MAERATLDAYEAVAPPGTVDLIRRLGRTLAGRTLLHVNATRYGGGVAEILQRLVPLFAELDIPTRWETIEGTPLFFQTTKSMHNTLQGDPTPLTPEMFAEHRRVNDENAARLDLEADAAVIHDPQPSGLVRARPAGAKWAWRCHIDISRPQRAVWRYLRQDVAGYDAAIFSLPGFAQKLALPQFLVYPSIDPLSDKNRDLEPEAVAAVVARHRLPADKPLLLQVSRFDRFKDPLGVIAAYRLVKPHNDCCLVLAGGGAADDPEGQAVLETVRRAAADDPDIFVLDLPADAHREINALQRAAAIVLQKSTREGFGLTVAEAMWKGKPVIGGAVGGITVQIIPGLTGFTVSSVEGCAYRIRQLLNNPELAAQMGDNARDYTRRNFLITRHLLDYLALMAALISS